MFPLPKGKPEFSVLEEAVLQYWKEFKIFEKSVELRSEKSPYRFYDGPPFITGTPHYGSLLSSIIKDVIPRYQTMRGKRVERVWGWDCHGLPIEQKVQKKLGLESNKAIEESEGGIQKFIDECYNYTNSTSAEWNWYVDHIGRWVDMEHAYRTMDQDYMESVMWVFKQIWEKGYVYEGKRVSWYSWKLSTPISNFEIAMDDSYQDVQDPAVTIRFPIKPRHCSFGWISDKQGRLLMGWNFKHNQWYLPGGKVEEGESPEACFIREAQEEIGVKFTPQDVKFEMQENRVITGCWNITHFSAKISADVVKNCEPDKFREWRWFTPAELDEIYPTLQQIDQNIIDRFLGRKEIPSVSHRNPPALKGVPPSQGGSQSLPVSMLAWTTTPWTLPMNMALAVNKDLTYVLVQSGEEQFVLAKSRVETVFKGKGEFTILEEFKGEELLGIEYEAPFKFYQEEKEFETAPLGRGDKGGFRRDQKCIVSNQILIPSQPPGAKRHPPSQGGNIANSFKVYHADFVTDTDGTGIAHEAPEFGDVDFQLAKQEGIHITFAIDKEGKYTAEVPDYQGQLFLDVIDPICERLKLEGTLFKKESITHRVPFCPRSNTQLMQKAQKSWFIDIARIKKELVEQNEKISWFPEHFKHGRFLNSLESAPDWCISRSRFWGTPMPVWQNEDGSERVVVSSREELYQLNKPLKQITKIIFVRHGESEANRDMYLPFSDNPLTKNGEEMAKETAKSLKEIPIDVLISSPFERARKTADIIAKYLKISVTTDDRIVERDAGQFIGHLKDEKFMGEMRKADNDPTYKMGVTGESLNEMYARLESFVGDIIKLHAGKTILLVSHDATGRTLFSYLRNKKFADFPRIKNASIHTLYLDNNTGKELNLHRPTIDRIYIPSKGSGNIAPLGRGDIGGLQFESSPSAQNPIPISQCNPPARSATPLHRGAPHRVLGIHGFKRTDKVIDFFSGTKKVLKKHGVTLDAPEFEVGDLVHYKTWEAILDGLDIEHYDTWITHSMGAKIARQYIIDHDLHLKRLIFVAPRFELSSRPEMQIEEKRSFIHTYEELRGHADEIIVIASRDDSVHGDAGFDSSRKVAKATGAQFVGLDGWGHFNVKKCEDIEKILLQSPFGKVGEEGVNLTPSGDREGDFDTEKSSVPTGRDSSFQKELLLHRIPEVLDVWMDSASMPYAQVHYPFENVEKMEASFPADFIAEYTGQIRAWFYVMHVLGVLVKGSPAYKNVVVTGVINGTDGRKMSKSYGNYPDPRDTILKYGADAIRFYLMSGPIMRGEDMNFSENGIQESIKRVILPLWNAYTFFSTYANIDHWEVEKVQSTKYKVQSEIPNLKSQRPNKSKIQKTGSENTNYQTPKTNELDIWIISQLHTLIGEIRTYMDSYDLQKTCEAIMVFLDGLNNWYIRRNRRRFWRAELDDDKKSAYETLHEVLVTLTQLLAPICPFISDYLYGCLTKDNSMIDDTIKERHNSNASDYRIIGLSDYPSSVHLTDFPEPNTKLINQKINQKMTDLQALTNLGLAVRGREKLRVRQPLRSATITLKLDKSTQAILAEELNVKEIHIIDDVSEYVTITYSPDAKKIGATERKQWMKTILTEAKTGRGILTEEGNLVIKGRNEGMKEGRNDGMEFILSPDEFETVYTPKEGSSIAFAGSAGYVIGLDVTLDEELTIEGYSRDLVRAIQDARKEMGFAVTDRLKLQLTSQNPLLGEILKTYQTMIEKETLTKIDSTSRPLKADLAGMTGAKEVEIDEGFVVGMNLTRTG